MKPKASTTGKSAMISIKEFFDFFILYIITIIKGNQVDNHLQACLSPGADSGILLIHTAPYYNCL